MKPGPQIDLHTHSCRSDGALTPALLVERAAAAGVSALALTDHDTVEGIEEAAARAADLPLELIAGVEISASWRAQSIHVLGLWVDPAAASLRAALAGQAERRRTRMRAICARLTRARLPGDALLAAVECEPGLPTRAHLARAMVAAGIVEDCEQAFRRYLGRGKPAHLAADWPPLAEVLGWIRAAGGVASLAHPARYTLSAGARRQLLADFKSGGGIAIEVVAGGNATRHIDSSADLAVQFGFEGSIGSDFHDPQLTWNPLGRLAKLPDRVTPVWRGRGL